MIQIKYNFMIVALLMIQTSAMQAKTVRTDSLATLSPGEVLSPQRCRDLAIANNNVLRQEQVKVQMSNYDKWTAIANYFPNISLNGAYVHNGDNISLISQEQSASLQNLGTAAQGKLTEFKNGLMTAIMSNQDAAKELLQSQMWQTFLGTLSNVDISKTLNELGTGVDNLLHFNVADVGAAAISLQQPIFAGGRIVASNKIAVMAEELAKARYDERYRQTIVDADNAYWQVVSISAKTELAQDYCDLLKLMLEDITAAEAEGTATRADVLGIKVKANEAALALSRATNGKKLAKMLLCKQIGLPLDSEIKLEHEGIETVELPQIGLGKSLSEICERRPEMKQLGLASDIYKQKVNVARASMMPTVAFTANYLWSNPNVINGFSNKWADTWNVGVMVNIPIFHGTEAWQKTRKAKAEAKLYSLKYDEARNMINLQVNQLRCQYADNLERVQSAQSNLDNAEENLRAAMAGFEEGVIPSNTAMAAQTAWLKAHSEYIDAGIALQMTALEINNAEGNIL